MSVWRAVVSGLVAPLTMPVLYAAVMLAGSGYPYTGGHMPKFLSEVALIAIVTYPPAIALEISILWVLSRLRRLDVRWCLAIASAAGLVLGCLLYLYLFATDPTFAEVPNLVAVFFAGAGGLIAFANALVFCLLARLPFRAATPAGG